MATESTGLMSSLLYNQPLYLHVTLHELDAEDPTPTRRFTIGPPWSFKIGRGSQTEDHLHPKEDNSWFNSRVMSRDHAVVRANPILRTVEIEDVGSMHGTYILGKKLRPGEPQTLYQDEIVAFGANIVRGANTYQASSLKLHFEWSDSPKQLGLTRAPWDNLCDPDGVGGIHGTSEEADILADEEVRPEDSRFERNPPYAPSRTFSVPESDECSDDSDVEDDIVSLPSSLIEPVNSIEITTSQNVTKSLGKMQGSVQVSNNSQHSEIIVIDDEPVKIVIHEDDDNENDNDNYDDDEDDDDDDVLDGGADDDDGDGDELDDDDINDDGDDDGEEDSYSEYEESKGVAEHTRPTAESTTQVKNSRMLADISGKDGVRPSAICEAVSGDRVQQNGCKVTAASQDSFLKATGVSGFDSFLDFGSLECADALAELPFTALQENALPSSVAEVQQTSPNNMYLQFPSKTPLRNNMALTNVNKVSISDIINNDSDTDRVSGHKRTAAQISTSDDKKIVVLADESKSTKYPNGQENGTHSINLQTLAQSEESFPSEPANQKESKAKVSVIEERNEQEHPPCKRRKTESPPSLRSSRSRTMFRYTATALAGAAIGAVSTVFGLAALPADYFT